MDSQDTPRDESQLDNLEQKDCQFDCTSNCENNGIVITSTNGSIELQTSSNSQPLSDSSLQSCMDVTESDSVNPVVTSVLKIPLQNVVSSQNNKDLSSAISIPSVTTVNCHKDNTDSDVLMDVSSSDHAVSEPGFPESSTLCSVVRSSTCSNADEIDASVEISHEVQQSDLSTSSDTRRCEGPKLQLNPVSLQADEPVNVINGCGNGEINSSIDDCSISQMPAECLETDKEHGDKLIECDEVKISSSTDDGGVSQLPSECDQTNQEDSNALNGIDSKIESQIDDSSVPVEINIKQEPYDLEYERSDLIYRSGAIVVDSDDDTSSTVFSNHAGDSDKDVAIEEEVVEQPKVTIPKPHSMVRTEGEVFPEELPPLEYLTISPDASVVLETLGTVSGVVGVLVIVKANLSSPALFDDTVLFLEGRQPLGLIFEIFGTVEQPYYSVRFNTNKDIEDKGIVTGDKVFFAPKADNLTKYVFIAELRKIKCDDASWENDNEPPPAHLEYSDDEKERQARQQQRNKDRGKEETPETCARRKKRRKKPSSGYEKDPHGPQLLQGDLNRNPFGNKNQTFNSSSKPRWPRAVGNGQSPNHRPRFPPQSAPQPQPTFSGAFRNPWPPQANFAERPGWNQQPGLLGRVPNTAMSGSPNTGHFTNNFSSHQSRQPHPGFGNAPFPPPAGHSSHGPNPHLPQNSMPPQPNRFETYFPRGNMEHVNTFAPPPVPHHHSHRPPGFPMFSPSHPPPVVNAMFNQHRPPHLPPRRLDG